MARIQTANNTKTITIDKFLGLNLAYNGDTQLELGESGNMYNCYITKDYDLTKIEGYKQLITSISYTKSIQGMWYGSVGGTNYFVIACNGKIYKFNNGWEIEANWGTYSSLLTEIGTATDTRTTFFGFDDKLYMINGNEYMVWTGSGSFADVDGYVPKIRIACKPSTGAGTTYEFLNLLTGKKRATYKADNTTVYQLPETNLNSIDYVYLNGALQTVTTHYTVDLTAGTVTFISAPAPVADEDEVEIHWTKGTGDRDSVVLNKYAKLVGDGDDTRVFLFGHTIKNQRIHSNLALGDSLASQNYKGTPSPDYFCAENIDLIGSSNYSITDIVQQQNIILTFTDQPRTYYAYYDIVNLDGIDRVNFPTPLINETRGNVAPMAVQLLNNEPYSIDTTIIKWTPTTVKNERNMEEIGQRIQKDLNEYDLRNSLTIDFQNRFEYWLSIGKKVWIYNYGLAYYGKNNKKINGVFSRLYLDDEPTCWLTINGELYFGTTTGKIMKFSDSFLTFNSKAIDTHWEMNMFDFGTNILQKTLNRSWITLSPKPTSSIVVKYVTNKDTDPQTETKQISISNFDDVDFNNFTFLTNYNPQTLKIRLKSKKWTYLKLVIDNTSSTETFTILDFTMLVEYGNQIKEV